MRSEDGFGGDVPRARQQAEGSKGIFGSFIDPVGMRHEGGKKKMSTTNWLAERHGITNTTSMYVEEGLSRVNVTVFWMLHLLI